jgi:hypothetical protein
MDAEHTMKLIAAEFTAAKNARTQGNEGRCRVHARRAVGHATRYYLGLNENQMDRSSAYDLLGNLEKMDNIPIDIHQCITNLLKRVNTNYQLPDQIDLIADAHAVTAFLFAKIGTHST